MRRCIHAPLVLALSIVAIVCAWLWLNARISPVRNARDPEITHADAIPDPPSEASPSSPVTARSQGTPEEQRTSASAPLSGGKSKLTAYRITVRNGILSLDGAFSLFGDFHVRRAPPAWMPGMWCIRMLDGNMRVLAEDTARAPDATCIVLDPRNPGADGNPQATQFSGLAEEAMLQIRLPPHPDAQWLRIYRLESPTPSDWNQEPDGELLASFPIP